MDELAFIGEIAEQERSMMRRRSFRVGPADDELLAIKRFGDRAKHDGYRRAAALGRIDRLR
jgi:hypothetical protein